MLTPQESAVANPGFDVTPARLVTGLITERGVCAASAEGLLGLYPERAISAGHCEPTVSPALDAGEAISFFNAPKKSRSPRRPLGSSR